MIFSPPRAIAAIFLFSTGDLPFSKSKGGLNQKYEAVFVKAVSRGF